LAKDGNAGDGPFGSQPGGNRLETAPLVVALLVQTLGLHGVARLDWHRFKPVRTPKNSVNRPSREPSPAADPIQLSPLQLLM
ncbi:hypothetical protein, partial [Ottowia sp.]|uniref:hypothetical protein n=1 Tax=Ottowia sp. TaxID=1898956 RepID=UPI002616BF5C